MDTGEHADAGEAADATHGDGAAGDAAGSDAHDASVEATGGDASTVSDARVDAADGGYGCFQTTDGVYGECMTTSACMALGDHISTPGFCPGPASVECCTDEPDVSDNPPTPAGWMLMQQANVTPQMTQWAVMILNAPVMYPMWSTTTQLFGSLNVLARVEWHPPDFQNMTIHRGVTLYQM